MAAKKKIINLPVFAAFLAILLPLLATLREHEPPDLTGYLIAEEPPALSRQAWFSGHFQKERDQYNDDHWALKEKMVRFNNQLYYDLFGQLRLKGFVTAKEDYIISESYIFSAFGDDLMREGTVDSLMRKARLVQDSLKHMGVDLLLVFAPGKGVGCRALVPDKYVHPFSATNHSLFTAQAARHGLNTLDLLTWFEDVKDTARYPLWTPFGHHWSYYGECIAVDTILTHIAHLRGTPMPRIVWDSVELTDSARHRDADVVNGLNLLENPVSGFKFAYPDVNFIGREFNTTRVVTISDSYWYGPVYMGVNHYAFAQDEMWYYYNKIVPRRNTDTTEVWQTDLRKELAARQVVMLLYSDANLPTFGNGFIQEAYLMFTDPAAHAAARAKRKLINTYARQVRDSPLLLRRATEVSQREAISLDSAVVLEAMRIGGI